LHPQRTLEARGVKLSMRDKDLAKALCNRFVHAFSCPETVRNRPSIIPWRTLENRRGATQIKVLRVILPDNRRHRPMWSR
jgi:hypothetical protein